MNLTVPPEAERRIKDISARLGCKPRTAALAALRLGAEKLTYRDVEAEMSEADLKRWTREKERQAAKAALKRLG